MEELHVNTVIVSILHETLLVLCVADNLTSQYLITPTTALHVKVTVSYADQSLANGLNL